MLGLSGVHIFITKYLLQFHSSCKILGYWTASKLSIASNSVNFNGCCTKWQVLFQVNFTGKIVFKNYFSVFFRVRHEAAFSLVAVCNRLPEGMFMSATGVPQHPLVSYFQHLFCSKAAPDLPRLNNYVVTSTRLQEYFLAQSLVMAIAQIRVQGGKVCPDYVVQFLVKLIKYNDNTTNL